VSTISTPELGAIDTVLADLGRIDPTLAMALSDMVSGLDVDDLYTARRAAILTAAVRVAVQVAEALDHPTCPPIG